MSCYCIYIFFVSKVPPKLFLSLDDALITGKRYPICDMEFIITIKGLSQRIEKFIQIPLGAIIWTNIIVAVDWRS